MDINIVYIIVPLLAGWLLDRLLGDPAWLPHPIVLMGKIIAWGERKWNHYKNRLIKGGLFSISLILICYALVCLVINGLNTIHTSLSVLLSAVIIFYCLAGKTLIKEVRKVFVALEVSVEKGREQVARIVGRDTSNLTPQQIGKASLETLSENLSDGVVAPLFWYMLLGVPGMLTYKMINTLDSMIGYKSDRYRQFGCIAARIDDIANYIPARLTSLLMIIVNGKFSLISFVAKYGKCHASPNSGYPEAALAAILDCRFGGPNNYFGQVVDKPYIGHNDRLLTTDDMVKAVKINQKVEILMLLLVAIFRILLYSTLGILLI